MFIDWTKPARIMRGRFYLSILNMFIDLTKPAPTPHYS
jgi:hypothetical protein